VVNPRTPRIESTDEIRDSIERTLHVYPAERLFLNPDCGFGTFAHRPVNVSDVALRKIENITTATRLLRGEVVHP
jgi:5-methyltetrahydropteroyltriglutamate--homocysteine methyltransferase